MKIKSYFFTPILLSTVTLPFFLSTLSLPFFPQNSAAENYTQINLPRGAKARLGKGSISDIAYSPDGKRLAVAGSLGIWIYDVQTGDEIDLLIARRWSSVRNVSFSPDGKTLASGSEDNTIRLWDVNTGNLIHIFYGHQDNISGIGPPTNVYSVAFSPNGQMLVSGGRDTIYVWDTSTFVPNTEALIEDINNDGVVNIQDLVRIAARIGQDVRVGGDPADVNGDGIINIQDVVQVVGAICH